MKYNNRKFTLKNNEEIVVQICCENEAENLIKTVKNYLLDSNYIPLLNEEFNPTIEQERNWINSFIENENSLLLIATYNKEIIGNIDLTGNQRKRMKHTAVIGMGILKEWQNTGLGTILLSEIMNWAKNNSILEKLYLEVYEENQAAIKIYEKIGFQITGKQTAFFKHEEKYFNKLTMEISVK